MTVGAVGPRPPLAAYLRSRAWCREATRLVRSLYPELQSLAHVDYIQDDITAGLAEVLAEFRAAEDHAELASTERPALIAAGAERSVTH